MPRLTNTRTGWKKGLILGSCMSLFVWIAPTHAGGDHASQTHTKKQSPMNQEDKGDRQHHYTLLPSHRIITGVVESVAGDQAKVNSGDTAEISPRYLSLERAKEKGFTLKAGDQVEIVVDAKNLVADYHLKNGEHTSHHQVIKGRLAQPLKVGQEQAVIKTQDGKEKTFPVRPLARSEVAAIPFDTDGLFLIDETNKIASATLTKDVVAEADWARSTAMNVYRHVDGIIQKKPKEQTVVVQTKDSETISLPVWDYLKDELTQLSKGMHVTLLVDGNDKVVDIAHLPSEGKE